MALTIVRNEIDAAGFRRVVIRSDAGEHMALKFPPGTSAAAMRAKAQEVIDAEVARRQDRAQESVRVDAITDGVGKYLQGQLSNAQKATLLDALAKEWKG